MNSFSVAFRCICSGLTPYDWIAYWGLIPRGDWLSLSHQSLIVSRTSSRGGALSEFPHLCWHVIGGIAVLVLFRQPCFMGAASLSYIEDTMPQQTSCVSGSSNLSAPLLWGYLSLRCRGCLVGVSTGVGHVMVSCPLHLDQLWISAMISIHCTQNISDDILSLFHVTPFIVSFPLTTVSQVPKHLLSSTARA